MNMAPILPTSGPHVVHPARHTPAMPVLTTALDAESQEYQANRASLLEAIGAVDEQLALARAGGGERYVERHRARGKLLARERIELLLDRDSPFLELVAARRLGNRLHGGRSLGHRDRRGRGRRVPDLGQRPDRPRRRHEPVDAAKSGRAADIALENRLPIVSLVESGGADLPTQARALHPRWPGLPRPHPALGRGPAHRGRWSSATRPPEAPMSRA